MRKLFFIAMIVLGTSLAQAQANDITLTAFSDASSTGNNYALTAGSLVDDKCVQVRGTIDAVGTAQVFTYNASTRALSLNGRPLTIYSIAEASSFGGFFNGEYNALFSINSQGEYVYVREL